MEAEVLPSQDETRDISRKIHLAGQQGTAQDAMQSQPQSATQKTPQSKMQQNGSRNLPHDLPPDISTINAFASFAIDLPGDAIPFYEAEGRLLALWDQLNELKLEISLLQAQSNPLPPLQTHADSENDNDHPQHQGHQEQQPLSKESLSATLKQTEEECLEARAAYSLKQSVVEDVLVTGPILKAVHLGSQATPTEQALTPLINRRDVLGIASTNLTSALQHIHSHTSKLDIEHSSAVRKNRELAPEVIALAREVKAAREEAVASSGLREQLEEAMDEVTEGKKRWRIMKSVVAAVVAGSGVDWAGDEALRELVLDDETGDGIG